ncbi:MAG: hypothetical protein AB2A00_33060 [Myxococcota bacterium]
MPRIEPGQLRALAQRLATDGQLSAQDVGQLIDTAMSDGTLSTVAKTELKEILAEYKDHLDSPETEKRLQAFLSISTARLRNLAHTLEKDDGVISAADADKLAELVNADGKISRNEKYSLGALMVANRMSPEAKTKVDALLGREVGGGGQAKPLDPSGTHRPVFLSASGFFVEDQALDRPRNLSELGSGLFRMADLVDDMKDNPLTATNVPLADRQKVMANLATALSRVPAGGTVPAEITDKQALQLRSSAATVLMSLVEASGTTGDELKLKEQALNQYVDVLKAETNPILRDSMVWNLSRVSGSLPTALKAVAQPLVDGMAPKSPPYDDWFKNGNKTLNVSWTTGPDEEFFPGTIELLKKQGYTADGAVPSRGPATMVKTYRRPNGEEVEVRIKVGVNQNNIFKDMNREDVHIVGYDGHSDIGRTVPGSLRGAPNEVGKKLIFTGMCAGKDNLHNMRERFPDAQVITTFTSSYFNTEERNGGKVMSRSENFNTLMELINGAVKKQDWEQINENIRDNAVLFPWSHVMPGGTNYISPAHTEIRRKVLDTDHDGQADYLDKFANFDTFKVATDTAREFQPLPPSHPAETLEGTVPHLAAQALNTATGYNGVTHDYKKQNVIGAGYFEPKAGEKAIVKFERTQVDGQTVLHMSVNSHYAHMSVEALRAVAHYEFIQQIGQDQGLSTVDRKLMGLTFAAFSIMYDEARWGRDETIWTNLLKALGLPAEIPFAPIRSLLDEEHHDYSGNMTHVREWKRQIPQPVLDALGR